MRRPPFPNRVSLRDVAQAAGVTHPTVSRALAGDKGVSEATRRRIKALARKLGYRPDPALSILATYRSAKRRPTHQGRLAYLHPWGGEFSQRASYAFQVFLPLVRARAEELGYKVEVFTFFPSPQEQRRLSHVLYSQGIDGVFVGEMPPGHSALDHIAWHRFSAIALDASLKSPRLPYISDATPKRIEIAYAKLREAGFRRIGYITRRSIEENADSVFLAAYLKCLFLDGLSPERLPPCFYTNWKDINPLPWLRRHRFDAVISTLPTDFMEAIKGSSFRIPDSLGLASVYIRQEDSPEIAGCTVDWALWGSVAVDLLNKRIHHGDRGADTLQTGVFIDTIWRDGATARRK